MTALTSPAQSRSVAIIVPEERRGPFLPNLFGERQFLIAEHTLYSLMGWLSPEDYNGGFWDFYELNDQPLYLVPPEKDRYRIACDTNGFEGEVSADAAGIIVTLFTLSHMSFKAHSDHLADSYQRLFDFACEHPEASAILGAID
jgi:hypothetical protein